MNKAVCIYPEDCTTDFLRPLCNHICASFDAVEVGYDISGNDDPLEAIFNEIKEAQTIFFLGHGMSTCLYASIVDNVKLIDENNISLLAGKRLFLLACDSNQLIDKYKIANSIGFGFLPTSLDDARSPRIFHNIPKDNLKSEDVAVYKIGLVNILINTLSKETLADFYLLKRRLLFNTSLEIVDCLINKKCPNYRIVADELYYVHKDIFV